MEGWHGMLNRHAKHGNFSLYVMVGLLHEQAQRIAKRLFGVRRNTEEKTAASV